MELPVREELREIAARIRDAIEAIGTQAEAARLTGLSATTLKRYVAGRSMPSKDSVEAIATAAKYSFDWIMNGKGHKRLVDSIGESRDGGPSEADVRAHVRRQLASACETAGVDFDAGDPEVEHLVSSSVDRVLQYAPEQQVFIAATVASAQADAILFTRQQAIRRAAGRVRPQRP